MSDVPRRSGVPSGARPHEPGQPGHRGEAEEPRQLERPEHVELAGRRDRSPRPAAPALERPTEWAEIEIYSEPLKVKMSAHGALALGVVGPAATIIAGYPAGLPVWAILAVCTLQIVAAIVMHRWR
jgi:hypothetical protein